MTLQTKKLDPGEIKITTSDLIFNFKEFLIPLMGKMGLSTNNNDEKQFVWEFFNRFYCNLISLENSLNLKDALSATLIQRYNHEMYLQFFWVFGSQDSEQRAVDYFTYEDDIKKDLKKRTWTTEDKKELRKYIPPRNADEESLKIIYRKLSDLAHPNSISMRLNRRGVLYEYIIIKDSISLCIFEICLCMLDKSFRDRFTDFNSQDYYMQIIDFRNRAVNLLIYEN